MKTTTTLAAMLLVLAFGVPLYSAPAEDAASTDPTTAYEARTLVYTGGDTKEHPFPYRLLKPADLTPEAKESGKKWPLIVFLHGAGERGDDNRAQLKYFPTDMLSAENRERYKTFIVAPQCPRGRAWSARDLRTLLNHDDPEPVDEAKVVLQILDGLLEEFPIDPDRVYLTGLSMGGFGSWYLAALHPEKWAAVVPICGGGNPATAERIQDIPIWVFHGGKDTTVPPERSRVMVEALKEAGGSPRYTEFADAGHNSWDPGYQHPEFLPWLMAQRRGGSEEGFVSLFDGKTLEGWTGSVDGYVVEDGVITCKPRGGGNLYTEKEYSDFVLRFEVRIPPHGNNGVGIRAVKGRDAAYHGFEIQVLDDPTYEGSIADWQRHGSIYGVVAAKPGHLRPAGEWNEEEITWKGRHITVRLNGSTIVDADLDEAREKLLAGTDEEKRRAAQHEPGFKAEKGYICFCGHGSAVSFRNIRIQDLSETKE